MYLPKRLCHEYCPRILPSVQAGVAGMAVRICQHAGAAMGVSWLVAQDSPVRFAFMKVLLHRKAAVVERSPTKVKEYPRVKARGSHSIYYSTSRPRRSSVRS